MRKLFGASLQMISKFEKPTDDHQESWCLGQAYGWPTRMSMFGEIAYRWPARTLMFVGSLQMTSKDVDVCGKPTDDQQGHWCLWEAYRWPASLAMRWSLFGASLQMTSQFWQWGEVSSGQAYRWPASLPMRWSLFEVSLQMTSKFGNEVKVV